MLDTNEDKSDKYVLGEINCSCVGFTSHLDMGIQDKVAEEAIRQVENKSAIIGCSWLRLSNDFKFKTFLVILRSIFSELWNRMHFINYVELI